MRQCAYREAFNTDMIHKRIRRQDRPNQPMDRHLIFDVASTECSEEIVALCKQIAASQVLINRLF